MKKLGLDISRVGSHSFSKRPCNPEFHDEVVTKLTDPILALHHAAMVCEEPEQICFLLSFVILRPTH